MSLVKEGKRLTNQLDSATSTLTGRVEQLEQELYYTKHAATTDLRR